MQLYLVRHGDATTKAENPERPLTKLGRDDASRLAAYLAKQGVTVVQIRHSGKTRARETAEIIGGELNPEDGVVQVPGLKPNDDVRTVMQWLWEEEDYCSPPLKQEREAVFDKYFLDLKTEKVAEGEGWKKIKNLPRVFPR